MNKQPNNGNKQIRNIMCTKMEQTNIQSCHLTTGEQSKNAKWKQRRREGKNTKWNHRRNKWVVKAMILAPWSIRVDRDFYW